ncbi:kinase-like domain-containing protein [Xylaria digitata]|nr:kinase-like domain-containing protein [Xylaria digitata]
MDSTNDSARSKASTDDDVQSISRSSLEQPQKQVETLPGPEDAVGMERHRNMMLASLLEDYYRSRALEFLNASNPGQSYTRQSREVEAIASRLFGQASQVLSSNGLLSSRVTSNASQRIRRQYLSGLDSLVAGSQPLNILDPMRDLVGQTSQLNLTAPPDNDLQLTLHQPLLPPRSHYKSSFREDRLLGRGGFGKVYQCYNLLDQNTYAVKKIPLPRKLGKSFSDGRHDDLADILREVKAMAVLDHPNIVRYHATWVEEPQQFPELLGSRECTTNQTRSRRQQLLLDSHAFEQDSEYESSVSGGIIFGEDTLSHSGEVGNYHNAALINRGWSEDASLGLSIIDTTLASESDIFAGGGTELDNSSPSRGTSDTGVPALYIQMSMYPMTLAQFLSPSSSSNAGLRHCFHLVPTLRLTLSIHEGLQYIHSKGLIHRDIKPGNIFLSSVVTTFEGGCCDISCRLCAESNKESSSSRWLNPRIGDFGLVHQLAQGEVPSSSQSSTGSRNDAGTTYYQPPRRGERKDEKIDIFALGVVFIEMLCRCNTAMERADMLKGLQRGEIPPELRQKLQDEVHDPKTADRVVQLASCMIDEDPDKRWSGSKVREALQDLMGRCCGH